MSATDELVARCGIHEVTEDAEGVNHPIDSQTRVAILQAMGLAARDEEEAKTTMRRLDAEAWGRTVPPVIVANAECGPITVPIILPRGTREFSCTIALEDGTRFYEVIQFSELPLIGERENGGRWLEQRVLTLKHDLPWGYHSLRLGCKGCDCSLIVTPSKCWLPDAFNKGQRVWGLAAQLYLIRSDRNWGIGDFTDLRYLIEKAEQQGADVIGVNPLHALFTDKPEDASPYSPADRLLLNILNIDIEAIPELEQSVQAQRLIATDDFQQALNACRHAKLVDYSSVCDLKLACLKLLFDTFETKSSEVRRLALEAFRQERQEVLDRACLFQAIRAHFVSQDPPLHDPQEWPEEYRYFGSTGVKRFMQDHSSLVRFHLWMQWIADTQLRAACDAGRGMEIGLYRDLAVGANPHGAEAWSHHDALAQSARVGAPPDIWNPVGQNWGLPPFNPLRLRQHAYVPFIELLRANMRYAGALRIDHAMALERLYWIPAGNEPNNGAYVHYSLEDLVAILALESHRNRCLVVGEDLGTVPEGFRERMAEANILSYRVLFFERDDAQFLPPDAYPSLALSVASSHDLPTLQGWLAETDLDLKDRLHLFPSADRADMARKQRHSDHKGLMELLQKEKILGSQDMEPDTLLDSAHSLLARTRSLLTLIQLDDIAQELEQVNVPCTSNETPNWRRRLSLALEQLDSDERFLRTSAILRQERNNSECRRDAA